MATRTTKYSHIVPHLPKLGVAPERRALLDIVKEEILQETRPEGEERLTPREIQESRMAIELNIQMLLADLKHECIGHKHSAALFTRSYVNVRSLMDQLDEWKSSTQLLLDVYEMLMVDQMEVEGLSSMRLESGPSVSTYMEPYASVADKETFRQWCVAPDDRCMICGGHEDALGHQATDEVVPGDPFPFQHHPYHPGGGFEKQLQLWPSTMNAITKERLLKGEPAPDGVEVFAKTMVRLNKG